MICSLLFTHQLYRCLHVFKAHRVECGNTIAKTVRVLSSFFLATESGQTSSNSLNKEKFNVSLSESDHEKVAQIQAAFNSVYRVSLTLHLTEV